MRYRSSVLLSRRLLGLAASLTSLVVVGATACRSQRSEPAVGARDTTHASAPVGVGTYRVEVVHQYPHDVTAFTEGLEFHDGALYESTGLVGQSGVRRGDLSGALLSYIELRPPYFGEGITIFHGTLYELTWKDGVGFRYDASSFAPRGRFSYAGEGWGLTHDDRYSS